MTSRALVLALAALLVVPAAASAGTASVSGSAITFVAAPGETNQLLIEYDGAAGTFSFHDNTAPVTAGPGCRAVGTDEAQCPAAGATAVTADLGDGNDISGSQGPYPVPVTVHGGDGSDELGGIGTLFGDDGADKLSAGDAGAVLDGGPGKDDVYDGAGDDQLFGGEGDDYIISSAGSDLIVGGLGDDQLEIHTATATIDCENRDDDAVQPDTMATLKNCLPAPIVSVHAKHVTIKQFVKRGLPVTVTCDHACAVSFELLPGKGVPFHGGGRTMSHRGIPRTRTGYIKPDGASSSFIATAGGHATRKGLRRLKRCRVILDVVAYSRDGLVTEKKLTVKIG